MAKRPTKNGTKVAKRSKAVKTRPRRTKSAPLSGAATSKESAPAAIGALAPRTIVYVHGIGNKPEASILKCQWDRALFGSDLGERSRMAYWVNRRYYPTPLDETCRDRDIVRVDDDETTTTTVLALAQAESGSDRKAIEREIAYLAASPKQRQMLASIAEKMSHTEDLPVAGVSAKGVSAKVIPLPKPWRRFIAAKLTRAFLRDVNDFLFKQDRREAMENALLERLETGGPFVVVAHSQGTMIAYDLLSRLDPAKYEVALFVTIGSPLGMQEVQDQLKAWHKTTAKLPRPACVKRWVNVADKFDPVAIDSDISNDFSGAIENEDGFGLNPDSPWHPHSSSGYLATHWVRKPVIETVGSAFGQTIAPFALAKDLVSDIENGAAQDRHSVLIQLVSEKATQPDLDMAAAAIEKKIWELIKNSGGKSGDAEIDRLQRFLAARLTRGEAEALRSHYKDLSIKTIWRNSRKRALIADSTHAVQAEPANLGYGADGAKIAWAVLDTGVRADHPHFTDAAGDNLVVEQYDCLSPGPPILLKPTTGRYYKLDGNGHGTHVAGIIAGASYVMHEDEPKWFRGMAPRCKLYGFKVLDDAGDGDDAAIIKALDRISLINEKAGRLVIHGVNLSLGGDFDPDVYGCGHTPLCQELKRLWRQGVLIVLAAGNEGSAVLQSDAGAIRANMDLSIGDPANLEEAIAVGSVHKTNPHTYGISYFSSRGPTADGRVKPDVVAPGERVISARHDWNAKAVAGKTVPLTEALLVEMSGTSMAAPHVSGLLAAFLSRRREFIGEPDRVKQILINACIDLKRDRYMQGAGLPNLIGMLALH